MRLLWPQLQSECLLDNVTEQGAREQSFLVQHFLSDGLEDPWTSDFAIQILNPLIRGCLRP